MKVPLFELKTQYAGIRTGVEEAIRRVLESQQFILGPEVQAFEEEVAAQIGVRHAIGVSSGTDALLVCLMALEIEPGDEVITTPFSFFASAAEVSRLGGKPVFVDVEADTLNIDATRMAGVLSARTRAIIPVHLYGRVADMAAIERVADEASVPIIEDAAQAIGALDARGMQAGTMGLAGCFSFFPTKNLGAAGDAGLVTSNDDRFADCVRILRVHGGERRYYHRRIGGNFRLDAMQAAVLRVKRKHLEGWTSARRRNAARYRERFGEAGLEEFVRVPGDVPGHIYHQFVIRAADRDALRERLSGDGIGSEIYYPLPLHLQECFADLGYGPGDFPVAEAAARDVLALPIYPELTQDQIDYVVSRISGFYRGPRC
jgi:dTDP-4-amino-4,6-dideoxygalactose transaminase